MDLSLKGGSSFVPPNGLPEQLPLPPTGSSTGSGTLPKFPSDGTNLSYSGSNVTQKPITTTEAGQDNNAAEQSATSPFETSPSTTPVVTLSSVTGTLEDIREGSNTGATEDIQPVETESPVPVQGAGEAPATVGTGNQSAQLSGDKENSSQSSLSDGDVSEAPKVKATSTAPSDDGNSTTKEDKESLESESRIASNTTSHDEKGQSSDHNVDNSTGNFEEFPKMSTSDSLKASESLYTSANIPPFSGDNDVTHVESSATSPVTVEDESFGTAGDEKSTSSSNTLMPTLTAPTLNTPKATTSVNLSSSDLSFTTQEMEKSTGLHEPPWNVSSTPSGELFLSSASPIQTTTTGSKQESQNENIRTNLNGNSESQKAPENFNKLSTSTTASSLESFTSFTPAAETNEPAVTTITLKTWTLSPEDRPTEVMSTLNPQIDSSTETSTSHSVTPKLETTQTLSQKKSDGRKSPRMIDPDMQPDSLQVVPSITTSPQIAPTTDSVESTYFERSPSTRPTRQSTYTSADDAEPNRKKKKENSSWWKRLWKLAVVTHEHLKKVI